MPLLEQFNERWAGMQCVSPGHSVLLAVSGGEDSMVMAHLFLRAGIPFGIAHCNFGLRGADSDGDEQFVHQWCTANNIPFYSVLFDTKQKSADWKKGTQETARILRYEWFELIRQQHSYAKIATAHHANDNIETLFINLCKGSGISGLHGIPTENGHIVRPILFAPKSAISAYAAANDIAWRDDVSNTTDDYLRNAVRHKLVPVVEELFPNAVANLTGSIVRFGEAEQLYDAAIAKYRRQLLEQRGNDHYIAIRRLRHATPLATICYELLRPFSFTSVHVPQVLGLLTAETGKYVSSATHRVIRNRDFLIITTLPAETADFIVVEAAPCVIDTGRFEYHFSLKPAPGVISADPDEAVLRLDKVSFPLLLRTRRTGDYLYPFGMGMKKKKVSRLLTDAKVPLHEKGHIHVLETGKRIAWVAGIRIDERFKVKDSATQVLHIKRVPKTSTQGS